jgi:hypothetical protein
MCHFLRVNIIFYKELLSRIFVPTWFKDDFKDGNLFLNVETLANLTNPSYANDKCLAIFL